MPDIFTSERRSEIMSLIRGKNTKPELLAFAYLRKQKIYFQRHYSRAKGKPDIALPRRKLAVFIDGDFWHGRGFQERKLKFLENDQYYWIHKIERNMLNDQRFAEELSAAGWRILRVWGSDIMRKRTREITLQSIAEFLRQEKIPLLAADGIDRDQAA